MTSQPSPRRGRKAQYVTDRSGKPIVGLSRNASDGRYYATHSAPRVWLGRDFDIAVQRFRALESHGSIVAFPHPDERVRSTIANALEVGMKFEAQEVMEAIPEPVVREEDYWARVGRDLRERPHIVAERTGFPEVARLASLSAPKPSPTLESLGRLYLEKAEITDEWRQKSERFWREFRDLVQVKTAGELTQDLVIAYFDAIRSASKSPTYARHRFGAVKRVFTFAKSRGINPDEMRRALDCCAIFEPPKGKGTNPEPISRDDFSALLNAAEGDWKSLLLCALNFAMYGAEVAQLEWSEIDLAKGTLVTDRNKTGVVRIAVLWPETISALSSMKRKGSHVFLTREGRPYDPEGLRTAFRKLRDRAGMADTVKFNHIRDGAYSAAVEGAPVVEGRAIPTNAMLLAGHATGMPDHYVKRNPRMVADACEAVRRQYFG